MKPKILTTRIIGKPRRFFQLEEVDLRFSNGEQRCFKRLVNKQPAVMIVPFLDEQTLLLIREYAVGVDQYELGLPKGCIEPGEAIIDAANRELQEETGYAAKQLQFIRSIASAPGVLTHTINVVLAEDLYVSHLVGDEPEPIEVVPWPLDQLTALMARSDFSSARSIASIFLATDYLKRREHESVH